MERPSYKQELQDLFIIHYIGKDPQALIKFECLLSNLPTCFCFQLISTLKDSGQVAQITTTIFSAIHYLYIAEMFCFKYKKN